MTIIHAGISEADHAAINRAVQQAESFTSAEIIPVVAVSSGRYDRSEDIAGLWLALLGLVVVWVGFANTAVVPDSWAQPSPYWELVAYLVTVVVGFLLGTMLVGRSHVIQRLFTPAAHLRQEVQSRARAVFFDQRVHHTAGSTGVLVFVSLMERMAVVLTDQQVLERIGQAQIDAWCEELTQRLHAGPLSSAVCETVHSIGQTLAQSLPRTADDVNELPDALILLT